MYPMPENFENQKDFMNNKPEPTKLSIVAADLSTLSDTAPRNRYSTPMLESIKVRYIPGRPLGWSARPGEVFTDSKGTQYTRDRAGTIRRA